MGGLGKGHPFMSNSRFTGLEAEWAAIARWPFVDRYAVLGTLRSLEKSATLMDKTEALIERSLELIEKSRLTAAMAKARSIQMPRGPNGEQRPTG